MECTEMGALKKSGVVATRKMVKGPGHAARVWPGEERRIGEDVEERG